MNKLHAVSITPSVSVYSDVVYWIVLQYSDGIAYERACPQGKIMGNPICVYSFSCTDCIHNSLRTISSRCMLLMKYFDRNDMNDLAQWTRSVASPYVCNLSISSILVVKVIACKSSLPKLNIWITLMLELGWIVYD